MPSPTKFANHVATCGPSNISPTATITIAARSKQIEGFRDLLTDILSVNLTLVSVNQNAQTKKVSAWAAILVIPTIITGIYGMNFEYMPEELRWISDYPLSLALMVLLYRGFKRSGWL